MWETLLPWFTILYFLFFLITIVMAIWSIRRKRLEDLAYPALAMAFITPITTLFYLIGRTEGSNELEYFLQNVAKGDVMAIFVLALYGYLIFWWVVMTMKWKSSKAVNINKEAN
ncbi:hypothetical protein ACTWPF_05585 [Oceanobacillus sp. M65]|uniref:hypothetical protein n=1 Tax=Oceanobacillus sp. M65 TaxID=3457435 RepID=UPI003FCDBBE0